MPEEKDHRVAGPEGTPAPPPAESSPSQPPNQPPPNQPPANQPPPGGPPTAAAYAGPPPGGGGWRSQTRDWGGRRPVQLLAAGLVGAVIGGGLVGMLDVLDDDGDDRDEGRVVRMVPYGPGWQRRDYGDWYERMPPPGEWRRKIPPAPVEPVPPTVPPSPAPTRT